MIIRDVRAEEYAAVGELRVAAYRTLGLLPAESGILGTVTLYATNGFSRTPELDFDPVPGHTLRAYELALPLSPFPAQEPH